MSTSSLGKRQRFSQPTQAAENVSAIMSSSKDKVRQSENIPLSRIVRDPRNHRHIPVDWENPGAEILDSDPNAEEKRDFLEKLHGLAKTIKSAGLINPCVVYRRGEFYHLSSGQRRFLAHRLLGETQVYCVIDRDPRVRLQQWVENQQRDDPTLADKLQGVIDMLDESGIEIHVKEAVLDFLHEHAGMGRSQRYLWASVLAGPQEVRMGIMNGTIVSLRDAARIAGYEGEALRAALADLAACAITSDEEGQGEENRVTSESLDSAVPPPPAGSAKANVKRIYRPARNVVMKTTNTEVTRVIVEKVMGEDFVSGVDFNDVKQVNELMKRMVETLDKQLNEAR